jgi:hypothetical protein
MNLNDLREVRLEAENWFRLELETGMQAVITRNEHFGSVKGGASQERQGAGLCLLVIFRSFFSNLHYIAYNEMTISE